MPNQKGFAPIFLVILVVFVLVAGIGGYLLMNKQSSMPKTVTKVNTPAASPSSNQVSLTNKKVNEFFPEQVGDFSPLTQSKDPLSPVFAFNTKMTNIGASENDPSAAQLQASYRAVYVSKTPNTNIFIFYFKLASSADEAKAQAVAEEIISKNASKYPETITINSSYGEKIWANFRETPQSDITSGKYNVGSVTGNAYVLFPGAQAFLMIQPDVYVSKDTFIQFVQQYIAALNNSETKYIDPAFIQN